MPAAAAVPGFWDWSFDVPLLLVSATAILYAAGSRRTFTPRRTRGAQRWRAVSLYAALGVLAIALSSPLDRLSEQLFWAHMVQHVLLLMVAAPLLVLARPWTRLWHAFPLGFRRPLAGWLSSGRGAAPLRGAAHVLGSPVAGLTLFCAVLLAWHVPSMFDATLHSQALHALEHTLFLLTAVLFFKQVIPSPPLRAELDPPRCVMYTIVAMTASWALAVVLALAPSPLYPTYAHLGSRPWGISAMADQQIAAGIMWVPGSITFLLVIFAYVHRWLMPPAPATVTTRRLAGEH